SGGAGGGSMTMPHSAQDLHQSIDRAAHAAQPVVERLASGAHAAVDKLANSFSGMGGTLDDKSKKLGEAYGHFLDSGREYVRARPGSSVLMAVAAGWILAKLMGGRSRD
ncbi:MAG TPA: hypothetical protein VEB23_14685, partial [Ramlibacter sp.]|nr:hypothetical protein [Ramlibacter sp.]